MPLILFSIIITTPYLFTSLTVIVIICSWNIFCRETIGCIADNKRCFANSTISNKHTLYFGNIC